MHLTPKITSLHKLHGGDFLSVVPIDQPMTSGLLQGSLEALAKEYPNISLETIAHTAYGRPITVATIGTGGRQVLFSAAHHANEWITATVLLKFLEELAAASRSGGSVFGVPARTILRNTTLHLVPMVDPDGVDLVTGAIEPGSLPYEAALRLSENYPGIPFPDGWKANLLGVDLNLQYPAGWLQAREIKFSQGFTRPGPRDYVGRAPLTQLESRALAELTRKTEPALVIALHTQGEVIYWQFQDYVVPGAKALAEEFSRLSGYALEDTPYASSFAGYKDWFIHQFRRPGFTIELGRGVNPLPPEQFPEIYGDVLGILVTAALGLPS